MEEAVQGPPAGSWGDRVPQLVVVVLAMAGLSMLVSWLFDGKSEPAEAGAGAEAPAGDGDAGRRRGRRKRRDAGEGPCGKPKSDKEWDGNPPARWPEDGVFTMESLAKFDGRGQPLCLAICGKVVDCSRSDHIKPGFGYGKLWAGSDGTRAFALCSLKPEMANDMDWKLEDFSEAEFKALAGWYKHFTTKYPIRGTLKEYDGWDFSSVVEASVHETPFASQGLEVAPSPEGGTVPRTGDRVEFHGLSGRADLNGRAGTVQAFVAERQRFAVVPEGDEEPVLVQAKNIRKAGEAFEG